MYLSIVIPAYNEAARIGATLQEVVQYLRDQPYDSEVIVVDDGSTDDTPHIVRPFCKQEDAPEVRLVSYRQNGGKGYAVRTGMEAARGDYRMYYDADGSTPISEVARIWPEFEAGADIVVGSRALPESQVEVHQAAYRETMGRLFNVLLRFVRLTSFRDTQCGFKAFSRRATDLLFPQQRVRRYAFDAELLWLAQKQGLVVREVPVRWRNSPHSSVNPVTDATRMFVDILRIRLNATLGRYESR